MSIPHPCENMSASEKETFSAALPAVGTELVLTQEQDYSDVFFIGLDLPDGASKFSGSCTLISMIQEEANGCGKIDLIDLQVVVVPKGVDQEIVAGIYNANAILTKSDVEVLDTGEAFKTTAYNYGQRKVMKFIIPQIWTRQMQPGSSALPPFRFYCYAHKDMTVALRLYVKVHGPRHHRKRFVFPK